MANELDKDHKVKNPQLQLITEDEDNNSLLEISNLINEPEFADFVQTISDSIDDEITFDKLLSSKEVLHKALKILQNIKSK
ncbi:MAG: hypothetical protein FK733_07515 [Asgard group archaeon]|nr:hypothetical protein [Asgard group archaeon]